MRDLVYWQKLQARELFQRITGCVDCTRGNYEIIRKATDDMCRIVHTESGGYFEK